MAELRCPACGEDSNLRGQPIDGEIQITCQVCHHVWDRDRRTRCATCGGLDIVLRPQTMTAFARGNQLSIHGWRELPLCGDCDHDELMRTTSQEAPVADDYQPAAMHARPHTPTTTEEST